MSHPLRGPSLRKLIAQALFLCVLLAGGTGLLQAQTTITIGTTTASTYQHPVNMYWWHSISEALYTSSEISTAGWTSGPGIITNIRYNVATAGSYVPQAGSYVSIYLEETSATSMTSGTWSPTGTLVWTGTHPQFNVTGWWNFTLTTPYCYGGGNLIVRVVRYDFAYGTAYPYFSYHTTSGNMHRYNYADVTPPTTLNVTTERPTIQMVVNTAGNMTYTSSTTTQNNTNPTGNGQNNQEIIGMHVVMGGCASPMSATSFTFNTAGSTSASDIAAAKVYFTGGNATFSPVNQFGTTVTSPSGSFTVTGTQTLSAGNNYFWLAYDVAPTAVSGNVVDAQCNSITIGGTARTPTVTTPTGKDRKSVV